MKRSPLRASIWLAVLALACAGAVVRAGGVPQEAAASDTVYRPKLATPEVFEPFLKFLEPGTDAFPAERTAVEVEARLGELRDALRAAPARAETAVARLLAPDFRGGRLVSDEEAKSTAEAPPFAVTRAAAASREAAPSLDARAFGAEFTRAIEGLREITAAEFQVTAITPVGETQASAAALATANPRANASTGAAADRVRTDVRYDIVGTGATAWRVERVGVWKMTWRRATAGGAWQIAEWTDASHVTSRARTPVFTEITQRALGGNESFQRQLQTDLDSWSARLDSVVTYDSNGHHGVSVGDADGDGLDDLYIAQPGGLPNRLYRARGDGTFEDITERAGVGVLDDTTMALFADVDNDGDEDLILATRGGLMLFINGGQGRFSPTPGAFQLERPLQGALTSMAMADYDRDGFLDLYLCVYSYYYGAGEDKAGSPAPYHDAHNGPPAVLFHNDGHGRFVEATEEAGLDAAGNDQYHFAAAWADYDGDGWPDLLVANDFGTKNLYRNRGLQNGRVTFEDVAAKAGVLDYGAGMSAAFVDYDNDGLLDIYTGNMWSASGLRVTSMPAFMPEAPPEIRAHYQRHARGNSLFRNRGDGTFEDKTVDAHAEMGRWAWSADAIDFDSDGWEDLYIANGMLTRDGEEGKRDLDSFFWRQVVARSPLTRVKGTPYDDAWRAINMLLMHGSIASHQRNVFLRNDGHGGFDEVSGAVGLDLDQDGRSFAVLDLDRDGHPDLAVMAARQAPQLRVFRNDFAGGAAIAIKLTGKESNRDAVGAKVTIETDRVTRTEIVQAGSGFLSQRSKELLFGLGASQQLKSLTVEWPRGGKQVFNDVTLNTRLRLVEGGTLAREPLAPHRSTANGPAAAARPAPPPDSTWLYEPFPAPDPLPAALRGKPGVLLLWSKESAGARAAFDAFTRGTGTLTQGGLASLAVAVDDPANHDIALSYAIVNRHVFMNRQDLRLPTTLLLDAAGRIVKVYRERVDIPAIVKDAAAIEVSAADRLSRALPFPGTFYAPLPSRNFLTYGRELLDQGLEPAAIAAFERAAQANPSASTLYRLGTLLGKSGQTDRARAALERAIALQPDLAEAHNDLGALLAQSGDIDGAIARFRAAIAITPEYPDALNNLGYALLVTGHDAEARTLYEKALSLQPDFPEALNNLGMLAGRAGELDRAERYFRDALGRRPEYGEAANNLALVLVARGERAAAITLLEEFLAKRPQFENAYVTLAKIHFSANETPQGIAVLERLLQRNPNHPIARELLRQMQR